MHGWSQVLHLPRDQHVKPEWRRLGIHEYGWQNNNKIQQYLIEVPQTFHQVFHILLSLFSRTDVLEYHNQTFDRAVSLLR